MSIQTRDYCGHCKRETSCTMTVNAKECKIIQHCLACGNDWEGYIEWPMRGL